MSIWWRPCLQRLGEYMSSSIRVSRHTVCAHTHPYGRGWSETRGAAEMMGGRKRTNALDFNKELSQRRVWLYISHAEVIWDSPEGPELSYGPMGLKTLNEKKKERQRKKERNLKSLTTVACTAGKRLQPCPEHCGMTSDKLLALILRSKKPLTLTLYLFICCMATDGHKHKRYC